MTNTHHPYEGDCDGNSLPGDESLGGELDVLRKPINHQHLKCVAFQCVMQIIFGHRDVPFRISDPSIIWKYSAPVHDIHVKYWVGQPIGSYFSTSSYGKI